MYSVIGASGKTLLHHLGSPAKPIATLFLNSGEGAAESEKYDTINCWLSSPSLSAPSTCRAPRGPPSRIENSIVRFTAE